MVTIRVDHYFHGIGLSEGQFDELKQLLINNQGIAMDAATKLSQILAKEEQMADDVRQALDDLTTQVGSLESNEESLITYVQGLSAQLQQNAGNAAAIREIAAKLQTDARRMSSAILTPASGTGDGGTPTGGTGDGGGVPTPPIGGGGGVPTDGGGTPPTDGGAAGEPTARRG